MTAQDFLDKVSEKENGAAAKPAPKRRARREGGESLRRVDRPASNVLQNQPQNRDVRNAEGLMTLPQHQPLVPTKHILPPTKGMVQEIRLICMLATKVVVSVFGVKSVCQRGPPKQNEPGSAMVQPQCIGSAVKGIDSAKEKVPPYLTAVRLPQLFTKKKFWNTIIFFEIFFFEVFGA